MIGAAAAYMSGLFFASFFTGTTAVLLIFFAAVCAVIYGISRNFKLKDYIIIVTAFAVSFSANKLYTINRYDKVVAYTGTSGSFSGTIREQNDYGESCDLVIDGMINCSQRAKITAYLTGINAECGDRISFESCEFRTFDDDYLFNVKDWNRSRHIYLEAVKINGISVVPRGKGSISNAISGFRERIVSGIRQSIGSDAAGFLIAMLFGDKSSLDDSIKDRLYISGIGHIMTVSGIHVSIIAAVVMNIMKILGSGKYFRFTIMNVVIMLLLVLAGFPISSVRAVIMLEISCSAELFCQQNDSLNSLSAAALIVGIADPYIFYSSGFVLSYSGTFGAAVFAPYMTEKINKESLTGKAFSVFMTALCTSIAVIPASFLYFNEISLISPITNICLVPLCTLAMILGMCYTISGGAFSFLLFPAEILLKAVIKISEKTADVKFLHIAKTGMNMPVLMAVSVLVVAVVWLIYQKRIAVSFAIAAVIAVNTAISSIYMRSRDEKIIIAVLGRKANMTAVISNAGHSVVVDMSGNNKAPEYVHKYLSVNGLKQVDMLLLTENVQSGYASYVKELELFYPDKIYVSGNMPIYCGNADTAPDSIFTMNSNAYTLDIYGDVLNISADNMKIVFSPVAERISAENGLSVYYGNIPKNDDISAVNGIFLDCGDDGFFNNFEIILFPDGQYSIRRL